jgi:2-amino-4-hydroxy-6-hydroxymethyldihydropteridine diphosphokinase
MLLAIGANLPGHSDSPIGQVREAIAQLGDMLGVIVSQSRLFCTPCFPAGTGPDFVNAALACTTSHDADTVLRLLHDTEAQMGRERHSRWGARVIDIDLLAHGQQVLPDLATWQHWAGLAPDQQARLTPDRLILPHPRLQDRAFVLVPLMDVAPDWVHPVLKRSVRQMHAALSADELAEIRPIAD